MENINCNIDKTDKVHRIVVGTVLLLGALFDLGQGFMALLGLLILLEGALGKCGIPYLIAQYERWTRK